MRSDYSRADLPLSWVSIMARDLLENQGQLP